MSEIRKYVLVNKDDQELDHEYDNWARSSRDDRIEQPPILLNL